MSKFNLRLKMLRQQEKLTQQELADELGISKSSVNMYERGEREPGLDMLEAIADYFNVNLDYLMGKSDDPVNYDDDYLIACIPEEIIRHFDGDVKGAYNAWQARIAPRPNEELLISKKHSRNTNTHANQQNLTQDEKKLLDGYRSVNDEGKEKILDTLSDMLQLDRYKRDQTVKIFRAARSQDNTEPEIIENGKELIDKLRKIPPVTNKEDF